MSATPALLHRHAGIWEGVYTHVSAPDWRPIGTQRFRVRAEVFDSGPAALRRLTLVRERHTSRDPADWPRVREPPVDILLPDAAR